MKDMFCLKKYLRYEICELLNKGNMKLIHDDTCEFLLFAIFYMKHCWHYLKLKPKNQAIAIKIPRICLHRNILMCF